METYELILETEEIYSKAKCDILSEYTFLSASNRKITPKDIISFAIRMLDAIIEVFASAIRFLRRAIRKFVVSARDSSLGGKAFLKKYGDELKYILNYSVNFEGYDMSSMTDMYKNINFIKSLADISDVKASIVNGTKVFSTENDCTARIISNRCKMAGTSSTGTVQNAGEFKKALKTMYFGEKKKRRYDVRNAYDYINGYMQHITSIEDACDQFTKLAESEIKELENLKKLISANPSPNMDMVEQLNLLVKYKTSVNNDCMIAFEVMMEYINACFTQSKAICIVGLQEN